MLFRKWEFRGVAPRQGFPSDDTKTISAPLLPGGGEPKGRGGR